MIFITIGTQEPFDRLIKAIDELVPLYSHTTFVAQVAKSNYKVKNMTSFEFISPVEFDKYYEQAKLIISHAGMGSIISALYKEKPILIMPRLAKFGEHRNDHQLATATEFYKLNYVNVAFNEIELKEKLNWILTNNLAPLHKIGKYASHELISSIKETINS